MVEFCLSLKGNLINILLCNILFFNVLAHAANIKSEPKIIKLCDKNQQKTPYANVYMNNIARQSSQAIYLLLQKEHQIRYLSVFECAPINLISTSSDHNNDHFIRYMDTGCLDKNRIIELFNNPFTLDAQYRYHITENLQLICHKNP